MMLIISSSIVSFATVMSSVISLVSGLEQVTKGVEASKIATNVLAGDCFIDKMEVSENQDNL
jgi:hypothetical protein